MRAKSLPLFLTDSSKLFNQAIIIYGLGSGILYRLGAKETGRSTTGGHERKDIPIYRTYG